MTTGPGARLRPPPARSRSPLALLAAAGLAVACRDALSGAAPADPLALQRADAIAAAVVEAALLSAEAPLPELTTAPPDSNPAPAARKPRARAGAAAAKRPAELHLPLEALLQTTLASAPALEPPLDLGELVAESAATPLPDSIGVLERWKERVHVKRRSEPIGHAGPRQGTHSETDASLRIPVDESVSLEGGVRVDSRHDPRVEAPTRTSIPRVGVEVRF